MKKDEQVELVQIDAADLASSVSFSESSPFLFFIAALITCTTWKIVSLSALQDVQLHFGRHNL